MKKIIKGIVSLATAFTLIGSGFGAFQNNNNDTLVVSAACNKCCCSGHKIVSTYHHSEYKNINGKLHYVSVYRGKCTKCNTWF